MKSNGTIILDFNEVAREIAKRIPDELEKIVRQKSPNESPKSPAPKKEPYLEGKWDMFMTITSAAFGKQYYFEQENGLIYSKHSHSHLKSRDDAYDEFLDYMGRY